MAETRAKYVEASLDLITFINTTRYAHVRRDH